MSATKYEKFFKDADTDSSGSLTLDELLAMMRKNGFKQSDDEVKRMFQITDTSGDGLISLDEYMVAMGQQPPDVHGTAAMRRCFLEFDKNQDGFIDKAELRKVFQELKHELPDKQLERMVQLADDDGSGTLDYNEFIKHVFGK